MIAISPRERRSRSLILRPTMRHIAPIQAMASTQSQANLWLISLPCVRAAAAIKTKIIMHHRPHEFSVGQADRRCCSRWSEHFSTWCSSPWRTWSCCLPCTTMGISSSAFSSEPSLVHLCSHGISVLLPLRKKSQVVVVDGYKGGSPAKVVCATGALCPLNDSIAISSVASQPYIGIQNVRKVLFGLRFLAP